MGGPRAPRAGLPRPFSFSCSCFPLPPGPGSGASVPIRLDLGRDAKSGVVTVINESDDRLQVQMTAMEWTQDADGKDRYAETGDILFFPRLMIFDKKEEKILRAGIRVPAAAKEKAYRLFIEEIPGPRKHRKGPPSRSPSGSACRSSSSP